MPYINHYEPPGEFPLLNVFMPENTITGMVAMIAVAANPYTQNISPLTNTAISMIPIVIATVILKHSKTFSGLKKAQIVMHINVQQSVYMSSMI